MPFASGQSLTCEEVEALTDDFLDEEMSEISRRRFERHLEHCEDCDVRVREMRNLLSTARSLAHRPIPPAVSLRLRRYLASKLDLPLGTPQPGLYLVDQGRRKED